MEFQDYKKYKEYSPFVFIMAAGNPQFQSALHKSYTKESSEWLIEFVTNTVVNWQYLGLDPQIPEHLRVAAESFIDSEAAQNIS